MRTFRIRSFIILILFFLMIVPWLFFVSAHFLETGTLRFTKKAPRDEMMNKNMNEIIQMIESSTDKWSDPSWQSQLQAKLQQTEMEAVIISATDQEMYRSNPEKRSRVSSSERFSVIEDGRLLGKVIIYMPNSNTIPIISILAGLLLAFFIIGVEMRRFLVKPLEKMSLAARQVAAGDWEVELPQSRITEISEVRDGFEVMIEGLQASIQKEAELEDKRRFVITAIAHDLRTPLFALRGYLDGLEQGIAQSPDQIAKYIAVCKEKSAQLDGLVEDLFTFTKMEHVEMKLHNQIMDVKTLMQNSIDNLIPLAKQKHISISNHTSDDCFTKGDTQLLERVMNNLLDNAIRYTPANGEIIVQCHNVDNKIQFTIHDTGPGFSLEELQRIFEPLYRGEASRNRSTGGSGLGLAISQKIIRLHGGELSADNHSEGGAMLTGWIPVVL